MSNPLHSLSFQVLRDQGREALLNSIEEAEPFPIRGLFRFQDYFNEIDLLYNSPTGQERGATSGWLALEPFYRVKLPFSVLHLPFLKLFTQFFWAVLQIFCN